MTKLKVDIICLSTQDWNDLWTRKQRFMTRFAREGHRVLYVETQFHWVSYVLRFREQWRRILAYFCGPRRIEECLWVYTPPMILPFFQMWRPLANFNARILAYALKRQMRRIGMSDPLVYCYAPYAERLVSLLKVKSVVYECVDEFGAAKGLIRGKVVHAMERDMMKQAQVTIVTAPSLYHSKRGVSPATHLIPNAADVEAYANPQTSAVSSLEMLTAIPKPRIAFIGAIAYWVDLRLIEYLAKRRPKYNFVFIGPAHVDVSSVAKYSNVHLLGRRPFSELGSIMSAMDVCLNPYVLDGVSEGCSPLKLYEYLATGKPIVSVRMPEAEQFAAFVKIGDGYEDILGKLDSCVEMSAEELAELSQRQISESRKHSWDNRYAATKLALGSMLMKESATA